ncbi:DUF481 domain-containing protein [Pseudomaricurvus alkylphenolicus]|uniref:DUF481 domain-containing protein n=1 Tax=Pseudomaricurvus alkylphenolicus TaxID=1306991 RepID=UPI0014245DC5|nr:DUF481 domain-containing protein [Pseudomaricurvus alkylphenolicus]NIB42656.1 DUF481 domain-containing protein [Pseudomaricurvus alkylphenolicus]
MRTLFFMIGVLTIQGTVGEETPSSPWGGELELGFVSTSGNTETTTIKGRAKLQHEQESWRNTTNLDTLNTKEDDQRSAEKYFLSHKIDYKLSDKSYVFLFGSYDDDRFSGFDYQATVSAGYGRKMLNDIEHMSLELEVGPGFRMSVVDAEAEAAGADDQEEAILRGSLNYQWQLSDNAVFSEELTVESGSDNTISKSITALRANIVANFSLKLSYTIKYTEEVPVARKHADTETAVTLLYSF